MDIALTLSNRQISPQVVNMFQFENGTTTLNFTLDSYMYGEVNLRNYKAYAVTSINGNIDMTELVMNYDASKDKLTLSWNVKEFTLLEAGAVLYQIVFKEATASGIPEEGENTGVFYSYKAVLINREVIDGDNEISAKYPTLLKQWLDRMNTMADLYDAGVIYMNYGESILPADRLAGRLYFQYTDTLNTKGQFEDDKGNILSDPDVVHLFGNETIGGQKTFTTSPKVPTPATDSNDTTVANTAFIKNAVKGALTNTATMSGALTILGTASNWSKSVNVGSNSSVAGVEGTAVGSSADAANSGAALGYGANSTGIASTALGAGTIASAVRAIAIGSTAQATAEGAIQIGSGTNSTSCTLQVGGYTLLNTSTGLIPADRISDLSSKYLAKSGGAMTAYKAIYRDVSDSYLALYGGTGNNDGAQLDLCGANHTSMPGVFQLHARNADIDFVLRGRPDGMLLWDTKYVLNNSFTMTTDGGAIMLTAGTSSTGGAYLRMYGKDHSSGQGTFHIAASDGTTSKVLKGTPDGDLTWNGKPIVVLVAEQKPTSANGYTWYRKYSNGWVEQGGITTFAKHNSNSSKENTVSLPVEMADTQYYVAAPTFITDAGSSQGLRNFRNTRSTTGLTIGMYTSTTLSNSYDVQWRVSGYAAE